MTVAKKKKQYVVCIVPHLPAKELSPNYRGHWRKSWKAKAEAKQAMTGLLIEQDCRQWPLWERAHLSATFVANDRRRRDLDNLIASIKPYIDALVGINGVVEDDSSYNLSLDAKYVRVPKEEQAHMVFRITQVDEDG